MCTNVGVIEVVHDGQSNSEMRLVFLELLIYTPPSFLAVKKASTPGEAKKEYPCVCQGGEGYKDRTSRVCVCLIFVCLSHNGLPVMVNRSRSAMD